MCSNETNTDIRENAKSCSTMGLKREHIGHGVMHR